MRIEDRLTLSAIFREPVSSAAKARNAMQAGASSDVVEISIFGADVDDSVSPRIAQLSRLVQSENYRIDSMLISQRLIDNTLSAGEGL